MITFSLNGKKQSVELGPDTPLLWVLRDHLHLTGTKFGCGEGLCGACAVHRGLPLAVHRGLPLNLWQCIGVCP